MFEWGKLRRRVYRRLPGVRKTYGATLRRFCAFGNRPKAHERLVDGFGNSPPTESLIFLSRIFLSGQATIRKENVGKENEIRKWEGYF
jgi:hypothetical protein